MSQKLAFIGLGVMGFPIAGHLQQAGHQVTVYNRTHSKAEQWVATYGGHHAATPAQAAQQAKVIFSCVGNDDDLRTVMTGENGVFQGMQAGSLIIDHTTVSAKVTGELAEKAQAQHCRFIDAPVSGGQVGAENGQLSIMVGAAEDDYARAEPLLQVYAKAIKHMGAVGNGQLTKMINQICAAGVLQGLAEGLHFAKCAGLDGEQVLAAISQGAAQSWQMDHRGSSMLQGEFDFGFAVDWMRKDLAIALSEARDKGAQLPLTALVDQFYAEVQALGGGRWDTSSLIARLQQSGF